MVLKPKEILSKIIKYIPQLTEKEWDAKERIIEMRDEGYNNWKQTEWVGFYMEFLTERTNLPGIAQFKYWEGNVSFNGCAGRSIIDYKTSAREEDTIILNDIKAINKVVKKYKELIYVILEGDVKKEKEKELNGWRKKITGKSKYVLEGEKSGRKHRRLKTKFYPKRILYISINKRNIKQLRIMKQGRNADGKPRNPKYTLPKKLFKDFIKVELDISQFRKKEVKPNSSH